MSAVIARTRSGFLLPPLSLLAPWRGHIPEWLEMLREDAVICPAHRLRHARAGHRMTPSVARSGFTLRSAPKFSSTVS
jgi:hypothetical protein